MSAMTLGQAVHRAAESERAAAVFYERLAANTSLPDAKRFLEKMAAQEREHADSLLGLARRLHLDLPGEPVLEAHLVETAPAWEGSKELAFDEALTIAEEAEQHAALYYDAMADACTGVTADFFARLAMQEEEHVEAVQRLRDMMGF